MKRPKLTQAGNALNRAELDVLIHLLTWHNQSKDGFLACLLKDKHLSECRAKTFLERMKEKLMMQNIYNDEKWENCKIERNTND